MNFCVTWIRLSVAGSRTVQADGLVGHDGEAGRVLVDLKQKKFHQLLKCYIFCLVLS